MKIDFLTNTQIKSLEEYRLNAYKNKVEEKIQEYEDYCGGETLSLPWKKFFMKFF